MGVAGVVVATGLLRESPTAPPQPLGREALAVSVQRTIVSYSATWWAVETPGWVRTHHVARHGTRPLSPGLNRQFPDNTST